jgi:hypothetical protein
MPQTPEQAARAQEQIENFARLAYKVSLAVKELEDEFCGLADFTEAIGDAMPRLSEAAEIIADSALDWARGSNADFDPSA